MSIIRCTPRYLATFIRNTFFPDIHRIIFEIFFNIKPLTVSVKFTRLKSATGHSPKRYAAVPLYVYLHIAYFGIRPPCAPVIHARPIEYKEFSSNLAALPLTFPISLSPPYERIGETRLRQRTAHALEVLFSRGRTETSVKKKREGGTAWLAVFHPCVASVIAGNARPA